MVIPSYPVSRGIAGQPHLQGYKCRELVLQVGGLGVRLTTLPCKKKFVENLLREKKNPRRGQGSFVGL
jgi:hypothetical protein